MARSSQHRSEAMGVDERKDNKWPKQETLTRAASSYHSRDSASRHLVGDASRRDVLELPRGDRSLW